MTGTSLTEDVDDASAVVSSVQLKRKFDNIAGSTLRLVIDSKVNRMLETEAEVDEVSVRWCGTLRGRTPRPT